MKDYYKDFDGMDMPWFESPFFYDLLESVKLTEEQYNLAKHFHEEGYAILDLELEDEFLDSIIVEINNKIQSDEFKSQESGYHYSEHPRLFEAWKWSHNVLSLAKNTKVIDTLKFLYRRNVNASKYNCS